MRTSQVLRRAAAYLDRHGVDPAAATAEILMASVTGLSRTALYSDHIELTPDQSREFGRMLCVRCSGIPTQHITGVQGFRGLELRVRQGVFIPRPETEVLVDVALKEIAGIEHPLVADVGTGSGAIAISIADEHPGAEVFATDLSDDALALGRENAEAAGVTVRFLKGDLLGSVPEALAGRFDLIVSNPPYVSEDTELPPEVKADPPLSLFGGPEIYERLFDQAFGSLKEGGAVAVEIEDSSAPPVRELLDRAGFHHVRVTKDLNGCDRVVSALR
jgi:release factor glutamine methyltransferase